MDKQSEKFKNFIKKLKDDKKTTFLFLIAGVLALLVAFGSDFGVGEKKTSKNDESNDWNDSLILEYAEKNIEEKIKSLVSDIDGVGNVSVSVRLESTGTVYYAQNVNEKNENDSKSKDSEYIYTEDSAGRPDGLIVRIDAPVVSGVAVVCDAGESAVIKNEIKSMISSLYNIGSDRIYVGK